MLAAMGADEHSSGSKRRHSMLAEIHAQPKAILDTLQRHVTNDLIFEGELSEIESALLTFRKIIITASGSSRHAGLAGEIMIEDLAGLPVDVEYASEYSYRSTHAGGDAIVMVITQSGETADVIAAQREALARGARTIAISNVEDSTISREASALLLTHAGPERAVPATKSFTTQLTVLYLFALFIARKRGRMTTEVVRTHLQQLFAVPKLIERSLGLWGSQAESFAHEYLTAQNFLYLGRSVHYAIAREGALKLKEVSYVHAEGYPTGELKHGPQALVDELTPIVGIVTRDERDPDSMLRYHKSLGTLRDARQHGARLLLIANEGDREARSIADQIFYVPAASELLLPLLEVVPLQFFAYYMAVLNGYDVDHPRNLAKSVVRE
jgi:glucosamine--fructose-6-phosphate aminotransferase (isomerizing)